MEHYLIFFKVNQIVDQHLLCLWVINMSVHLCVNIIEYLKIYLKKTPETQNVFKFGHNGCVS